MLQIDASKACAADLKEHLSEVPFDFRAMQWYAHRVTVLRRKCLILMEARSRYAMVLTGLVKADFTQFPERFHDRLWREAVSLCQLEQSESDKLRVLVDWLCEEIRICPGSDRSVQAHINEIARELKYLAGEIGYLPEDEQGEFAFGLRVNQVLRKTREETEYFYPLEVFRDFWLGMVKEVRLPVATIVPFPGNTRRR
jgi:hypothetical protein